ncbi:hypothetical protein DNTS_016125 [Danionella cerebrum]|uniref:LIM zinc-binding domain-containing protein n=1 Tax=Danionella cerebrum TaxID=2873325 RepID=A0A553Q8Q4_9TELE|nr:hypothetical protein DNTS_016125 [Danionella translucida]
MISSSCKFQFVLRRAEHLPEMQQNGILCISEGCWVFTRAGMCFPLCFPAEKVSSLGKDWHRPCLRCERCSKTLAPGSHAEVRHMNAAITLTEICRPQIR